jgi:hypothetical protein
MPATVCPPYTREDFLRDEAHESITALAALMADEEAYMREFEERMSRMDAFRDAFEWDGQTQRYVRRQKHG